MYKKFVSRWNLFVCALARVLFTERKLNSKWFSQCYATGFYTRTHGIHDSWETTADYDSHTSSATCDCAAAVFLFRSSTLHAFSCVVCIVYDGRPTTNDERCMYRSAMLRTATRLLTLSLLCSVVRLLSASHSLWSVVAGRRIVAVYFFYISSCIGHSVWH